MSDFKSFIKKNFSLYHIIGIISGVIFSVTYWYKVGQFSNNILKNNIILIIIWGILVGYITLDLIYHSIKKL